LQLFLLLYLLVVLYSNTLCLYFSDWKKINMHFHLSVSNPILGMKDIIA
jgi:hypothetical protein